MNAAEAYPWDRQSLIPISEWGHDHWSTLAYLETLCVDRGGEVNNDRMRTNPRRHRKLLGETFVRLGVQSKMCPTILGGGREVAGHDDWDCLEDLAAAGLVEWEQEDARPWESFGGGRVTVRLTENGFAWAAALRAHKAGGGTFSTFTHPPVDSNPIS